MDNNQNLDNIIDDESHRDEASKDSALKITDISHDDFENVTIADDEDANEKKVRTPRGFSIAASLYDYVEIFAIAVIAVLFIFTFCVRLCRVDGNSMKETLNNNEMIISSNFFYKPKQGDIIVFHLSNDHYSEPLVKRVIATEGQKIEINFSNGVVKVDGKVYDDKYAYLSDGKYHLRTDLNKKYIVKEGTTTYFRAIVPKGHVFVLGDNRNGSSDSRSEKIGFVDVDCILGKAVLRISPFTFLD